MLLFLFNLSIKMILLEENQGNLKRTQIPVVGRAHQGLYCTDTLFKKLTLIPIRNLYIKFVDILIRLIYLEPYQHFLLYLRVTY
jgi:hypothetical protein